MNGDTISHRVPLPLCGQLLTRLLEEPLSLVDELLVAREVALREGAEYPTPNNLPAPTTSFVGREDVLSECEQRLGVARLLTLLGMGGSGKTAGARPSEAACSLAPG